MNKVSRSLQIFIICLAGAMPVLAQPNPQTSEPVITVIGFNGDVLFRREEWNDVNQTLDVGVQLTGQDLVFTEGGPIEVLCPDGTRRVFDNLLPRDVLNCPTGDTVIGGDGERRIAYQRGGIQRRDVPYLISPRGTLVATPQITLLWNHVPGAETYTLRLLEDTQTIWERAELDAEAVVTGRTGQFTPEVTLQEDSAYTVVVCASMGISQTCTNDEGNASTVNLSFAYRPLTDKQATALENIRRDFGANTPEGLYAQSLVLAQPLDETLAYYADAISLLEQIATDYAESNLVVSAEFHNQVGELYRRVGLTQSARVAFEQAQTYAESNTESYAESLIGLAFVADVDEAKSLLDQALVVYKGFLSEPAYVALEQQTCVVLNTCS